MKAGGHVTRLPAKGTTCKTIYDATAPFHMAAKFKRAEFRDVNPHPFAPDLFPKIDLILGRGVPLPRIKSIARQCVWSVARDVRRASGLS
jgi:hypothetical protein